GLARGQLSFNPTVYLEQAKPRPMSDLSMVCAMSRHRRRRVFVDTPKGRLSAGFSVPAEADAADVSMMLRERGWMPYRLRLESERRVWVLVVNDGQGAAYFISMALRAALIGLRATRRESLSERCRRTCRRRR